jgi:hypothetical protein
MFGRRAGAAALDRQFAEHSPERLMIRDDPPGSVCVRRAVFGAFRFARLAILLAHHRSREPGDRCFRRFALDWHQT